MASGEVLAEQLLALAAADALAPLAAPEDDLGAPEDPTRVRLLVAARGAGGEGDDGYRSAMVSRGADGGG